MELIQLIELGENTYPEPLPSPRNTLISDHKAAFDNIVTRESVAIEATRLKIGQCELFAYTLLTGFAADKIQMPLINNGSPNEFIRSII